MLSRYFLFLEQELYSCYSTYIDGHLALFGDALCRIHMKIYTHAIYVGMAILSNVNFCVIHATYRYNIHNMLYFKLTVQIVNIITAVQSL